LTFKLVRVIAREVDNLLTNFGVSRTFRSRIICHHLSDSSRDLATLTLKVTALVAYAVNVIRLCTKFEVRRLSRSEDIEHLLYEH